MLKTKVKASSVTNLTDARYFAAWEVAYLGFSLTEVSLVELAAMREWITGPKIVGELAVYENPASLPDIALDAIQLNELVSPGELAKIVEQAQTAVIVEFIMQGYSMADDLESALEERKPFVETFILSFTKGGIRWQDLQAGTPFGLDFLAKLSQQFPILIEVEGALPSEVSTSLPHLQGFAVRGGAEEKVGFKDYDALADFFEDLEME